MGQWASTGTNSASEQRLFSSPGGVCFYVLFPWFWKVQIFFPMRRFSVCYFCFFYKTLKKKERREAEDNKLVHSRVKVPLGKDAIKICKFMGRNSSFWVLQRYFISHISQSEIDPIAKDVTGLKEKKTMMIHFHIKPCHMKDFRESTDQCKTAVLVFRCGYACL